MKGLPPKKVRVIVWTLLIAGAAVAWIGVLLEITALSVAGIVVMLGSIIFHFLFYRCPYCGKFLDRSRGEFCPYCGKEINK